MSTIAKSVMKQSRNLLIATCEAILATMKPEVVAVVCAENSHQWPKGSRTCICGRYAYKLTASDYERYR